MASEAAERSHALIAVNKAYKLCLTERDAYRDALRELAKRCRRFEEYVAVPFTSRWQSTLDDLFALVAAAEALLKDN